MKFTLILSIKPKFANDILEGRKRFEFRRALFRRDVERVIVYSSSPERKVIGEFLVDEVLTLRPDALWRVTSEYAGIPRSYFDRYFAGKHEGHAIKIKKPRRYKVPLDLEGHFGIPHAPQSFCYFSG